LCRLPQSAGGLGLEKRCRYVAADMLDTRYGNWDKKQPAR